MTSVSEKVWKRMQRVGPPLPNLLIKLTDLRPFQADFKASFGSVDLKSESGCALTAPSMSLLKFVTFILNIYIKKINI